MSRAAATPPHPVNHPSLGRNAAWGVFVLAVIYLVTTALGFLSLKSPQDPIGDPYFTLMELLILIMTPLMVVSLAAMHEAAAPERKLYSLSALAFMLLMAAVTMGLHFVIFTASRPIASAGLANAPLLFAFKWPSVAYALDILAWDVFFPLSMLFAALVFGPGKTEAAARALMLVSAVLSFGGLIGVPLANMNYRNIGIIGYGVVAPVAFLLLGFVLGKSVRESQRPG